MCRLYTNHMKGHRPTSAASTALISIATGCDLADYFVMDCVRAPIWPRALRPARHAALSTITPSLLPG